MPEGPSIIILKEEIEALHLTGKTVLAISGNSKIEQSRLLNQHLIAIKSWGKHFLLQFESLTLRIHFLLFGSYTINERKNASERLRLTFENAELNFYACSVRFIEENLDEVYDWFADIMSEYWNEKKALKKLESLPNTFICDALLDQNIFAGVGNIIKNEVLYRTKIHPLSLTEKLPLTKLKLLVKEARNYSFDFLHWKKEFVLRKHWLAHNKQICIRCNLPFTRAYLGKTNRRSFYCDNCQIQYV